MELTSDAGDASDQSGSARGCQEQREGETGMGKAMALDLGVVCAGGALVAMAWAADTAWFDRHFLPSFFTPRHQQLAITQALRIAVALLGLTLILMGAPG